MTTMSIIGTIHEDVTTDVLGKIGAWQWMITLLSTALVIPTILNYYDDMLLLKPPEGVICVPDLEAVNTSLCNYFVNINETITIVDCNKWHVNFMWMVWIKKKWLIFCDKDMQLLSTAVIARLGLVFGSVIFGVIADSFGRRIVITISVVFDFSFRLIMVFCDSESWYRLLVFLKSLFTSANYYLLLVLVCEITSNSWRSKLNIIVSWPRILSIICTVPLANATANLETYNLIAVLIGMLSLIILRWIPESPQWLLYNRKIPKAEEILWRGAQKNKVKLCSDFKIRPVNNRAYESLEEEWTCFTILTTHNVRVIVLVSLTFWGLFNFLWATLYIKLFTNKKKYAPLQVLSVILFLGLLNICLSMKMKSRHLLTLNVIILGSLAAVCKLIDRLNINVVIVDLVSTTGLAAGLISYAILLNLTPRLFAIQIRSTLVGCSHAMGQIGIIACYIMTSLRVLSDASMMIVVLVITFILIAMYVILPDIDGRELPDTIKDMDYFSELSKPLRWATQKTTSPSNEEVEMRVHSFSSGGNITNASVPCVPAQPIGFRRLWCNLRLFLRRSVKC